MEGLISRNLKEMKILFTDVSDEVPEILEKRRQARFDNKSEKSFKGKTFNRSADLESI